MWSKEYKIKNMLPLLLSETAHYICSERLHNISRMMSVAESYFLCSCSLSDCKSAKRDTVMNNFLGIFKHFRRYFAEYYLRTDGNYTSWYLGVVFSGESNTALEVSVLGVILFRIFPHSDWMRRDSPYLSVFSPNAGKYGPKKLAIQTLFTQWNLSL